MNRRGFTMIEVLVVVSITAMLSSILIVYSRLGERQILLSREQAKLISFVLRAKSLALQTYSRGLPVCGYGVYFEMPNKAIIFQDLADNCASSDSVYSGDAENFETLTLDPNLNFKSLTLTNIIFIPPDPQVRITPDQSDARIVVQTNDGGSEATVKINRAGQVST